MRPNSWTALLLIGLVSGTACSEVERGALLAPGEPNALLLPPGAGEPHYYSTEVSATYYGGYAGYERADAVRSERFTEELTWSPATQFWNLDLSFPTIKTPLGPEYPDEVDVARVRLTRSSAAMYDRAGSALSLPSGDVWLEDEGADPNTPRNHSILAALSTAASLDAAPQAAVPDESDTAAALDRYLITPAASERTLGRLRRSLREVEGDAGVKVFSRQQGDVEVKVHFDKRLGAVTRTRVYQAGKLVSDTDLKYRKVDGVWVLAEEHSRTHGPDGKLHRAVRTYGNPIAR